MSNIDDLHNAEIKSPWNGIPGVWNKSHLGKESTCNVRDLGSPGEGNGYPLQYSGLENSSIVHGASELDMTEQLSLSSREKNAEIS